ncbi:hypothetical protein PHYPSEUDO_005749 [Phytophthora pseudosyringae]|uniref:Uncharacterized protein n=1 Tax=Phytophthora pseudosyringae TaxID=221518 RepID=A0A8T1VNK1_9STRA|nr:hypothetical protein PHYPSEUDO_005749 [Phytophthora pseudosyringae]
MLPETVERLLDSYLPHCYTEFTAEAQAGVEEAYGCRRLTMNMIDAIAAGEDAASSDNIHPEPFGDE